MSDLKVVEINSSNVLLLQEFLESLGDNRKSFRYFESRPLSVIENHLCTLLIVDEDVKPLAYGHLDTEDDIMWLGIAVAEGMDGIGLGNKMMRALLAYGRKAGITSIQLSVDKDNIIARKLYEKLGFTHFHETDSYSLYKVFL